MWCLGARLVQLYVSLYVGGGPCRGLFCVACAVASHIVAWLRGCCLGQQYFSLVKVGVRQE